MKKQDLFNNRLKNNWFLFDNKGEYSWLKKVSHYPNNINIMILKNT